jgi:hypothetical protein
MIDLQLWELMYTLNRDIIEKYKLIRKTDTMIEYMFKFNSFSIFPAFYNHMIIHKVENKFTTQNVETPEHLKYTNCVKLSTVSESVDITGTDHSINIEINLELEEESNEFEEGWNMEEGEMYEDYSQKGPGDKVDEVVYEHASNFVKNNPITKQGLMTAVEDFLSTNLGQSWEIFKIYENNNHYNCRLNDILYE